METLAFYIIFLLTLLGGGCGGRVCWVNNLEGIGIFLNS